MFTIESRPLVHLGIDCQARLDSLVDTKSINNLNNIIVRLISSVHKQKSYWEGTRHGSIDEGDLGVGRLSKGGGRI